MTRNGRLYSVGAAAAVGVLCGAALLFSASASSASRDRSGRSVIERNVVCRTENGFVLSAWATDPRIDAAGVFVQTRHGSDTLLWFDSVHHTIKFDSSNCQRSAKAIPLNRSGLPLIGTYEAGSYTGIEGRCSITSPLFMHFRLTLGPSGAPSRAQLALWHRVRATRAGKTRTLLRPIAYVQWAPERTVGFLAGMC